VKFWQIVSTIALSSVKHTGGGVPLAAGFGFSYLEIAGYTAIGGIIGVVAFIYFSEAMQKLIALLPNRRKKKKRIFTRKNRIIVRVKQNFGLVGIAFITPWLLMIPVGTIISCGIYSDRRRVFLYQSGSVIFWSFLSAAIAEPLAALFYD
jgi:hypothetical protein